jgi:hypothetical protein
VPDTSKDEEAEDNAADLSGGRPPNALSLDRVISFCITCHPTVRRPFCPVKSKEPR